MKYRGYARRCWPRSYARLPMWTLVALHPYGFTAEGLLYAAEAHRSNYLGTPEQLLVAAKELQRYSRQQKGRGVPC